MTSIQRFARAALFLLALTLGLAAHAQSGRTPPAMRLGDAVRPLAYDLALTLDPAKADYSGRIEIDVEVKQPTGFFWINGTGVQVQSAVLTSGGTRYEARAAAPNDQFIGLDFGRNVPAGNARLALAFTGRFGLNETRGLFKQQDLGEWYAFTQFESTNARRAFPCFDEPEWKTPWNVTLTVKRSDVAVSNAPEVSSRDVAGGMKEVRFKTTQPLPTYLVAFGVGPFDMVDGGTAGMKKTHLRYIVPKGRGADTGYLVTSTPKLLEELENYFASPYPFDKLDSLAIPVTVSFGAMENPGLITYKSGLMISRNQDDERYQQAWAGVSAHEMAHQWFGDLVTMQWWDDIWLNESFATWMSRKVTARFNPAWEPYQFREHERQTAFFTDRLSSSRQVRQPVNTRDDLANAFDRITYQKGASVLAMFEAWLGEAAFREGVQRYLKAHAWGNATAQDFFAALAAADASVVPAFSSFVLQPGLPLVDFTLDCSGAQPVVVLRQQRFVPAASTMAPQQWLLPACMKVEGQAQPVCTMLREREQRVVLPNASRCPAWVLPNPGGTGYFLSRLDAKAAQGLASIPLSSPEAIALVAEQAMLSISGAQPAQRMLDVAGALARDPRPEVASTVAAAVEEMNPAMFDAAARQRVDTWIREHFAARARELGWLHRPGDSDAVRKLRNVVVPLVAGEGGDAPLRAEAKRLALVWLQGDRRAVGSAFRMVLRTAARDADAPLVDAYIAAAQRATDSTTRIEIYKALGLVRDRALLRRAFEYALEPKLDMREAMELYDMAGEDADNAPALAAFLRERYDAVAARMSEETLARMPRRFISLCSAEDRTALQQFYAGPRGMIPGLQRNLAQTLETIDICVKARAVNASAH